MNTNDTLKILHTQSRIGRRVSLLLAYLNEHGPTEQGKLAKAIPRGLRGELRLAIKHDYIGSDGNHKLYVTSRGMDVILWLTGRTTKPPHWKSWEDHAKLKELRTQALK